VQKTKKKKKKGKKKKTEKTCFFPNLKKKQVFLKL